MLIVLLKALKVLSTEPRLEFWLVLRDGPVWAGFCWFMRPIRMAMEENELCESCVW